MRIRYVKPFEIPRYLLEQKKGWDLEVFYRQAYANPDGWISFILEKDETDIGAFILFDDTLSSSIGAHTLIVDKTYRTEWVVTEAIRTVYETMKEIASEWGRRFVMAQVVNPEQYIRRLGFPEGLEVREYIIAEEVG